MDYFEWFPNRLAQLRIQKGVSARDMSLSLGQCECYIIQIENGKAFPFEDELKEKSARLVELDTLLNLNKPEELTCPDESPQDTPDPAESPEGPDWDE